MNRGPLSPKRLLPILLAALAVLALAPSSLTASWVGWPQNPLLFVLTPVSHPIERFAARARQTEPAGDDPRLTDLRQQLDQERLRRAQGERRIEELGSIVRDLQAGLTIAPDSPARSVFAPIIGASPDPRQGVIIAGRGASDGVTAGQTVAVARGVHLVGRVVAVANRTCRIVPITHPRAGLIGVMVMTDDPVTGFEAQLIAAGEGTLRGDLVGDARGVEEGQTVRLSDTSWPASSQMVLVGRVVKVERKENQRLTVTVAPDFDVSRVSEVVLRIPLDPTPAARPPAAGDAP